MEYVMLPDLQLKLIFVCPIIESFEKIFMHHHTISCVIIYCITIIPNTLDKMANYIEFRVVKSWLT